MKKQVKVINGEKNYLLGKDKDGINYWLVAPSWDCGWYWGFGYVRTYTNNRCPEKSKDMRSHQHFGHLFLNENASARDAFKDFFAETPLTDDEIWQLVDYMKTFYTLKSVAQLFKYGHSWQSEKAKIDALENEETADLVNKSWLPEVFKRIEALLK